MVAAAAPAGISYVVLDRPNPIGGRADGAMMTTAFTTGVGTKEIVQQHGMTVGELARFFNGELLPADAGRPVDLDRGRLRGWPPYALAARVRLPVAAAVARTCRPRTPRSCTPGTGMFEGIATLSEGRGTTRPFELSARRTSTTTGVTA